MKHTMDAFYEKLAFVIKKYEEKTHVALLGRLKMKMSRKFSDLESLKTLKHKTETDEIHPH